MTFVGRTLFDPLSQQLDFFRRQSLARFRRRHLQIDIIAGDPVKEFAIVGIFSEDIVRFRVGLDVQPQVGCSGVGIGAVTEQTFLRQNRPNVTIESQRVGGGRQWRDGQKEQNSADTKCHGGRMAGGWGEGCSFYSNIRSRARRSVTLSRHDLSNGSLGENSCVWHGRELAWQLLFIFVGELRTRDRKSRETF